MGIRGLFFAAAGDVLSCEYFINIYYAKLWLNNVTFSNFFAQPSVKKIILVPEETENSVMASMAHGVTYFGVPVPMA